MTPMAPVDFGALERVQDQAEGFERPDSVNIT